MPLDCTKLPEFKYIVDRAGAEIRSAELKKRKELQQKVDQASYETLHNDINSDLEQLKHYNELLCRAKELWTDQVSA